MKTTLTFPSGTSAPVTSDDLNIMFPGRIAITVAVDGNPIPIGQNVQIAPGILLTIEP